MDSKIALIGAGVLAAAAVGGGLYYAHGQYKQEMADRRVAFEEKKKAAAKGAKGSKNNSALNKLVSGAKGKSVAGGAKKKATGTSSGVKVEIVENIFEKTDAELIKTLNNTFSVLAQQEESISSTGKFPPRALKIIKQITGLTDVEISKLSAQVRLYSANLLSFFLVYRYSRFAFLGNEPAECVRDRKMFVKIANMNHEQLSECGAEETRALKSQLLKQAILLQDKFLIQAVINFFLANPYTGEIREQLDASGLTGGYDAEECISILHGLAILGHWDVFHTFYENIEKIKDLLQSAQSISKNNASIPDLLSISRLATSYSFADERTDIANNIVSLNTPVITPYGVGVIIYYKPESSLYQIELTQWRLSEDSPVYVYCQIDQFTVDFAKLHKLNMNEINEGPHPYALVSADFNKLKFHEYHVRKSTVTIDFDRSSSSDPKYIEGFKKSNSQAKSTKDFAIGERKLFIQGDLIKMRSLASGNDSYIYGIKSKNSNSYAVISETPTITPQGILLQQEEYYVDQGEEDEHGVSEWNGYCRLKQYLGKNQSLPVNFYIKCSFITHRVLSKSEKARSDAIHAAKAAKGNNIGDIVQTPYGEGKIVDIRKSDGMYKVQLTQWTLSNDSPVFVFSKEEELVQIKENVEMVIPEVEEAEEERIQMIEPFVVKAASVDKLKVNDVTQTPYGEGKIVEIRQDNIAKIELTKWKLSGDSSVYVYTEKSDVQVNEKNAEEASAQEQEVKESPVFAESAEETVVDEEVVEEEE